MHSQANFVVQPAVQQQRYAPLPSNQKFDLDKVKKIMYSLSLAEVFLGCVSILLCVLDVTYAVSYLKDAQLSVLFPNSSMKTVIHNISYDYQSHPFTMGQGGFFGFSTILAGVTGLQLKKQKISPFLINAHMAFCIIGAVASFCLFLIAGILAGVLSFIFQRVLNGIMSAIGLISGILLIVSAKYCCYGNLTCCSGGCCLLERYSINDEQLVDFPHSNNERSTFQEHSIS